MSMTEILVPLLNEQAELLVKRRKIDIRLNEINRSIENLIEEEARKP